MHKYYIVVDKYRTTVQFESFVQLKEGSYVSTKFSSNVKTKLT